MKSNVVIHGKKGREKYAFTVALDIQRQVLHVVVSLPHYKALFLKCIILGGAREELQQQ